MPADTQSITTVDFVSTPTQDLERAVAFYRDTLGLHLSVHRPERNFAEFEIGNVTMNIMVSEKIGLPFATNPNPLALHAEPGVAEVRAELEAKGVEFMGDVIDTSVCHMAFFKDPDGNALMLHHRYAPRVTTED